MNKILSLVKKFYQASFFGRRASKKKERSREPGQNPKPANRWFLRLTNKEQIFFVKRLSFLTRAGVPILESLRMLRHFRSKQKTRLFDRVIGDVENGQSLATSLAKFDYVFGNFAVNIIRVGESAGILDQNLNYLADELKKKQELRHKIISALVYPGFIVLATLGIVTLLLTFVFPKVLPVFSSLKMTLPWSTRFLIAASNFIIKDGLFLLAGAALAVIIFLVFLRKSRHFIFFLDRLILRLPFIGPMVQSYQLTNFCRTFGLLLKSGVTISESVRILSDSTDNAVYKKEFEQLAETMARGQRIASRLENNPGLFPEIAVQMIATGEHSGNLSETLIYLSEMYENEVEEQTKNLSTVVEPFLMIAMGVLVGFIAISIIMPIYQITQNLRV